MSRTLAQDTSKKRKVIMGAAAMGAAGLIGWGAAMTALYACSPSASGGYIPNYDPNLKDITQELKMSLTQEVDQSHAGFHIVHIAFSPMHGSIADWVVPTSVYNFSVAEASNPETVREKIENYFQSQASVNGNATFTNILMGILFGSGIAEEINANDTLKDLLHIDTTTKVISVYGQKGPDENPLVKSIIDAANYRSDHAEIIEIGLGINVGFGIEEVVDSGQTTYKNNNLTQITMQTSAPITFQISDPSQKDPNALANNLFGRLFGSLGVGKTMTSSNTLATSGIVGDGGGGESNSDDDSGYPPCRISFNTGKYDFAVYNYRLNYNFFSAYMMNPYLSRALDRPTSVTLGQAALIGYSEEHDVSKILDYENFAGVFGGERFDFLGILSDFNIDPQYHSDPSIAILPVIDEAEHIRDSGIQIRLFNAALDPTPGHANAYPADPDFQIFGGAQFSMNNIRSGIMGQNDGAHEVTTAINTSSGHSEYSSMMTSFAPAMINIPSILTALALWSTPITNLNSSDAFAVNKNALSTCINDYDSDATIVAALSTAMDNGVSAFQTALNADRANPTTGDYSNIKALASKYSGKDRATQSASGSYSTLNSAPLAKEWLQNRLTTVSGDNLELKLQYNSGGDVTSYKTLSEWVYQAYENNDYSSSNGFFNNEVRYNADNLRYMDPRTDYGDKYDAVQKVYIYTQLKNGYYGNGTFDISIGGGTIYKKDGTTASINASTVEQNWFAFDANNSEPSRSAFDILNLPDPITNVAADAICAVKVSLILNFNNTSDNVTPQTYDVYIFPSGTSSYDANPSTYDFNNVTGVSGSKALNNEDPSYEYTSLSLNTVVSPTSASVTWAKVSQSSNIGTSGWTISAAGDLSISSSTFANLASDTGYVTARASFNDVVQIQTNGASPTPITITKTKDITLPVCAVFDTSSWKMGYYFSAAVAQTTTDAFLTRTDRFDQLEDSWKYKLQAYGSNYGEDHLYLASGLAMKLDTFNYRLSLNNSLVTLMQSFDNQNHGTKTNYRLLVRYNLYNGSSISFGEEYELEAKPPHVTFAFPIEWTW